MPAVTKVPGCTAKMGAWQSSFSPAEDTDLGHRSSNTEMGSGLSGSMKRVGERVGARIPASSHVWLSPGALPGCCPSCPIPGVFVSLGMMQRTKWGWVERRLVISLLRFSCRADTGAEGTALLPYNASLSLQTLLPTGREGADPESPLGHGKGGISFCYAGSGIPTWGRISLVPTWVGGYPMAERTGLAVRQVAPAGFAVPQKFAVLDASQIFVGKVLLQGRARDTGLRIFLVQSSVLSTLQFQCWCPH